AQRGEERRGEKNRYGQIFVGGGGVAVSAVCGHWSGGGGLSLARMARFAARLPLSAATVKASKTARPLGGGSSPPPERGMRRRRRRRRTGGIGMCRLPGVVAERGAVPPVARMQPHLPSPMRRRLALQKIALSHLQAQRCY
ncbi:hypothetical protein KI387_023637, partial [Taxus chinensis]